MRVLMIATSLSLALLCTVFARDVELTVDQTKPGPAISPYIYGQFIEHLGRCIHDGIWAEKLQDRKFLLEPGKSWEIVKPEGAAFDVFHDPAGAYAGDHCMALWLRDAKAGPCGIRQGKIGLLAGKEYVGYAILAAVGAPASVEIRLTDAQTITLKDVGPTYRKFPFRFRAAATTDDAVLSVLLSKPAYLWVAGLSLMPAHNVQGMRADTLPLIRQLNPPITRWPGGNFVSGYNWKDGIGDRDRRPPRWERAWNDVEDNDFGIDEFITFCKLIGTEPYIAVNTGLGSIADAADEVEYAKHYGVKWWGIGNEMYGGWQLGNVSVDRYALRHNAFVDAMRARDPRIKVIAVGTPGKWNDVIVPACLKHMDSLSGHHYTERKFRLPFSPEDARKFDENFLPYSAKVAEGIRHLVTDFRKRNVKGVRLAVDEWGIVREWNPSPDATGVGAYEHFYCLGDAIASARAIHELLRSADVVAMANWAQTVNVIGAIKTSRNHAVLDPAGHVMALYRAHLGGHLVPLTVPGDVPLDAIAARDGKTTSIALINYSPTEEIRVTLRTKTAIATGWRIDGPNLGAINIPGQPEMVTTTRLPNPVALDAPVVLPAHSITVLELPVK